MIRKFLLAGSALAFLSVAGAQPVDAQPAAPAAPAAAADPAAQFGAREAVQQVSLSPNGSKVAFIVPARGQGNVLYTVDVGSNAAPRSAIAADGDPERLRYCFWVSETRLVCQIYFINTSAGGSGQLLPFTRWFAVDADGKNLKLLSRPSRFDDTLISLSGGDIIDWLPGTDGSILMGRAYVPEARIGSHLEDKREGFGVDRLDTRSLSSSPVEPPNRFAVEYISDGRGSVRIMGTSQRADSTGQDKGIIQYYYRQKGSRDWKRLGDYDWVHVVGFNPYAVDPDLDVVYGFRKKDGRTALYSLALDGSGRETMLFDRPDVDVDGLLRIGRNQRVVGASYATDKRETVYFDRALKTLAASLSKALPRLPLVQFVDSSADESKLLLFAGSDTDPGRYYLFDKAKKQLNELMLARPELEGVTLAEQKAVTYKAADGTSIPAYLTLPPGSNGRNLPAIVMPHGGPGSRDEWGFDWLPQYFASRGYAVLQPEFRGSTGYGDAWFQQNGFRSWATAIGDVNDAGRWLAAQGIADPSKLAILGWSYGGYAALQANVVDPKLFKAVVAIAPVTDLDAYVQDRLDWGDYEITRNMVGSGPHVHAGSPAQNAAAITVPVLLFHGEMDRNVSVRQSRLMADRLKDAGRPPQLFTYPKLDHQLEDSEVRADMLRKTDAFLRSALKIQ
jgi:dienelactone hydrolase